MPYEEQLPTGNLILSRHIDEVVIIELEDGRQIRVAVADIRGNKARLAFQADKSIRIHREEVLQRVEAEKLVAPAPQEYELVAA